ncbi:hypothetical protein NLI96_g10251 [Meripilus lineatus]|uniref:Uncharacterized protein n=1 Tax=Meripilus lineatus TaxID=2056292 RepID=A0AAD5YEI6_9APHY|nr:hypothetical protein NLI96_g10251 [Physisporinus lineatus]
MFDDLFTRDAIGCVNAERMDRDSLRKALLGIQKTWDPTTGKVTPAVAPKPKELAVEMKWIYQEDKTHSLKEAAMVVAETIEVHGNPMIKYLEVESGKDWAIQLKMRATRDCTSYP